MRMLSQADYEKATCRAGMKVRGGNLTQLPHIGPVSGEPVSSAAWASRGMGLFVVDYPGRETVELDAVALRDVIVCAVVLSDASTDFAIGGRHFDSEASEMTMVFVPRGERFHFATRALRGLRAVTIVMDPISMVETHALSASVLPKSLLSIMNGRETVMDKLVPGRFASIAADVAARRGMFRPMASLYYEGKTLELISALLSQLSRRDAMRAGDDVFDPRTFERLSQVKKIIDQAPHRALDIVALARVAAMNRTKLRFAFKQAYGTTLSGYRTALLLQRADRALKEAHSTVQQAAGLAGYASASSFIVAYKRQYGVYPGDVLRQGLAS